MTATDANQSGKTWELSLYELQRTPQNIITDSTEIAVSVRSLHSELMCPICLDMLKETMTTKECLHRFCHDCIITALRAGNKECPTCRKKLISKRSLREDRNFDAFISRIYPNREDYELQQERVMAKVSKHNFAQNIEETQRMQAMNRARGNNKRNSTVEPAIERDSVPERNLKPGTPLSLVSDESSEPDGQYEFDNATTTDGESTTGEDTGEIELVIKPLPQVIRKDSSQTQTRYIKTTIWAQVSHIAKYLEMRYDFEGAFPQMESNGYANGENNIPEPDNVPPTGDNSNSKDSTENGSSTSSNSTIISNGSSNNQNQRTIPHEFTMYIAGGPGQFNPVQGNLSLAEVHEKFWRVNKPLELYYAYKMEPTVEKTTTGKNGTTTHKTW